MVMKDKLTKNNHKGSYYLLKKMSIALLIVSSAIFAVAVPTYIVNMSKKKNIGMAQETSSEIIKEEENSSEENEEYENYNDQEI